MIDIVRTGFQSELGPCIAEGIVARPLVELKTRRGDRIITKLKHKDFLNLYGEGIIIKPLEWTRKDIVKLKKNE